MPDPTLRTTFNTAAVLYDEMRPGYPDKLVEDILDLSGIAERGSILEVGCGTGQATAPFAARGYQMLCLDIGVDLITIAREKFKAYSNVSFEVSAFEEWQPDRAFGLLISATTFRWVDPTVRYIKARDALGAGGALAVFAHQHVRKQEGFFQEVQAVYDRYYGTADTGWRPDIPAARPVPEPGVEAFHEPIRRVYPWSQTYSSGEYIKLLGTYSDHIALPDENRQRLFEGIARMIDTRYGGSILKHYETVLDFRKKKD